MTASTPVFTVFPYTCHTFEAFPTVTELPMRLVPSVMKTFFPSRMNPIGEFAAAMPSSVASLLNLPSRSTKNAGWLQSQGGTIVVLVLVVVVVDVDEVDVDVLELLDEDVDVDELDEDEVDDDVDVDELVVDDVDVELLVLDDVELLVLEDVELDVLEELLEDVLLDVLDDEEVELEVDELVLLDDEEDELELDELEVDELVLLDVLLLVDDDVLDELDEVEVLVEVEVVVDGGGRPITSMRSARHLATVPGTVWAIVVHRLFVLLSQLTTVPTSTTLSASVSMQRIVRPLMLRSVLTPCSMSPQVSDTFSPW
jgi:hypothetical protein